MYVCMYVSVCMFVYVYLISFLCYLLPRFGLFLYLHRPLPSNQHNIPIINTPVAICWSMFTPFYKHIAIVHTYAVTVDRHVLVG